VDVHAELLAARVRVIDLLPRIDDEREMLQTDVVVAMLASIGRPESQNVRADSEVEDLLRATIVG
jgi:hypothetical protein